MTKFIKLIHSETKADVWVNIDKIIVFWGCEKYTHLQLNDYKGEKNFDISIDEFKIKLTILANSTLSDIR